MRRARAVTVLVVLGLMAPGAALARGAETHRSSDPRLAGVGGLFLDRSGTFYTDEGVPVRRLGLEKNSYLGPVFSPGGDRVAVVTHGADEIRVVDRDGTVTDIDRTGPSDDEGLDSLAWSPDGEEIAFRRPESETIWRVPVDGGPATEVADVGASDLGLVEGGLSWNPVDDRIAFTARIDEGVGNEGSIYTVPAAGGAPSRLVTAKCTDGTDDCEYSVYRYPTWSPDGTRLAAYAISLSDPDGLPRDQVRDVVVTVSSAGTPTERATLLDRQCAGSGGCTFPSSRDTRPVWSADGQALMVGPDREEGDDATVRYVRLGGATTAVDREDYDAWLPCGPAACARWGSADPGLTVEVQRRPSVVATGVASPLTGRAVLVRLERLVKHGATKRWALVKSARPLVDDVGGYEADLGRGPRAGKCRVKAAYEGENAVRPFAC